MIINPRRVLAVLVVGVLTLLAATASHADAIADQRTGRPAQVTLVTTAGARSEGAAVLAEVGSGYLSPVTEASDPFTHVMLRWEIMAPGEETFVFAIRASFDGATWTEWGQTPENHDLWLPADGAAVTWSQEVYAGEGMRFWQVRAMATPGADGRLPELRRVDVYSVDARFGPAEPVAEAGLAALGKPAVVSRTAWGSPDGQGSRVSPVYYPVKHLVVHHTADANSLSPGQRWADRVRAIWSFHTYTRGWGDIGYNYLIDPDGVVYEGRAGGDDAVAFHDTANYGSMGVVLIGTYASVAPQPAALDSLVELFAWKAEQKGIDPLGRSFYYGCSRSSYCNPFNPGGIVANIAGHREVTPDHTTCPGDRVIDLLPTVRQRVAERMSGAPPPDPATAALAVLGVRYDRQAVAAGELLKVTFSIKNTGSVALEGQAPEAARRSDSQASFDLDDSYVYDETECFLGSVGQNTPSFPKEQGRFRLLLGPVDAARQPACDGDAGGYPWRWGINGRLEPGETRDVVGYVLFRRPGQVTLQAGAIHEYVDYMARGLAITTITVSPEAQAPAAPAYDGNLSPMASVYRLGALPDNLLTRLADGSVIPRGAYVGSFAWSGETRDWGEGSPLASAPDLRDSFLVEQTRSFLAPVTGTYTFRLASDDGAWLWVNGALVVSNPGLHDAATPVTGSIELPAGRHTLAFRMFERSGGATVSYHVRLPGQSDFGLVPDGLIATAGPRVGARFRSVSGLTLAADDFGGGGVSSLRVAVDGGEWQERSGAATTLGPFASGAHTVRYSAVDGAGNVSAEQSIRFTVDPDLTVRQAYLPAVGR